MVALEQAMVPKGWMLRRWRWLQAQEAGGTGAETLLPPDTYAGTDQALDAPPPPPPLAAAPAATVAAPDDDGSAMAAVVAASAVAALQLGQDVEDDGDTSAGGLRRPPTQRPPDTTASSSASSSARDVGAGGDGAVADAGDGAGGAVEPPGPIPIASELLMRVFAEDAEADPLLLVWSELSDEHDQARPGQLPALIPKVRSLTDDDTILKAVLLRRQQLQLLSACEF